MSECIAIDYATDSKGCRLFKQNKPNDNSVETSRTHCSLGEKRFITLYPIWINE